MSPAVDRYTSICSIASIHFGIGVKRCDFLVFSTILDILYIDWNQLSSRNNQAAKQLGSQESLVFENLVLLEPKLFLRIVALYLCVNQKDIFGNIGNEKKKKPL